MDKDFILNKWVPALRSGKYKQGKGRLRTDSGQYCCLGVACDVADPDGWSKNTNCWHRRKDYPTVTLGSSIFGKSGSCQNPEILVNGKVAPLSTHNDQYEATFEQIADGLEDWVKRQEAAA